MTITNSSELKAAIKKIEHENRMQKDLLIDQFHTTYENLKPINILKNSLGKVIKAPGVVDGILNTTVGLGSGFLSKALLPGKSTGIVKKLIGTALELGAVSLFSKNANSIKLGGLNLLGKIFKSKKAFRN